MAVLVPGVILALITGTPILGFLQGAPQNWLLVSNLLLIGALVLVPIVLGLRGKKFEPLLQAALAKGQITPELRAAMDDPVVKLAQLYEQVSTVIAAALMVARQF